MSTEQQRVGAPRRYLSRLTRGTLAVIMAGGRGERLKQLTEDRCKPATPFGGKFRIIDFVLSNSLNSGIRQISVLTQYKAHSLIQHIGRGWGFLRGEFGEFIEIIPAQQRRGPEWYQGTADALWQNMELIRAHRPLHVLVLAGDHIYKMDYGPMIGFHVEKEADITVGVVEVPIDRAREFGVLAIDDGNRVLGFQEKPNDPRPVPGRPDVALASMGIYVFNPRLLERLLRADAEDPGSAHDFGKNIIPQAIENLRVFAYPFEDVRSKAQHYWRDVGTIDAYYEANMELVRVSPELNIYDEQWPIWTYQEQLPPAKFVFDDEDRRGCAIDSMVSGGCIISGSRVSNSLLFSQVRVHDYSSVDRSVILPRVHIGEHCVIRNAIIDAGAVVPDGTMIGVDPAQDRERFHVSENGVTLVTASMLRAPARGGAG
ncbi:MAG: glucose-1-phosphate adenylyltransferase [Steroidobacteraceae bacterium]|nr:glucose-1-phosphate adenylyltransferase [Pseudomonadota bacterium]MBP6105765.1 glucose-1-phosphate adenylyltransferase [Steroidobacteraceae bacterium]MBP7012302.1 glucose-1-phosphate adenylyltransferase [Steroidobacteraceae bacterium]